jgi:chromosome segregation ATPase
MFNAIRNFFQNFATLVVFDLAATVTRLEDELRTEEEFCTRVIERNVQYLHRTAEAEQKLAMCEDALEATQRALDDQKVVLKLANSSYRSLLRDWCEQREELDRLRSENELLKKKIGDAHELVQKYSDLKDATLEGYNQLKFDLEVTDSRCTFYKELYFEALEREYQHH